MTERTPSALDVVGSLMVEMGDLSARIEARGDRIVVQIPSLRAGVASLPKGGGAGRRASILRIHEVLTSAGLTLEVVAGRSTVGLLGVRAKAGLASRLLGLGPLEVRLGGIFDSFRRGPSGPA